MNLSWPIFTILALTLSACNTGNTSTTKESASTDSLSSNVQIETAADQLSAYLPLLEGKKVGLMGNQTSVVGEKKDHIVDVLMREKVDLRFAFAPEHGFRGEVERGEKVSNEVDQQTGLPLYTLYGKNEKQDEITRKRTLFT